MAWIPENYDTDFVMIQLAIYLAIPLYKYSQAKFIVGMYFTKSSFPCQFVIFELQPFSWLTPSKTGKCGVQIAYESLPGSSFTTFDFSPLI